jgi:hypothetical protein
MWTLTGPSLANTPNDLVASNSLDTGQTVTLASAGTYVLTVMPYATDTGGITMQLQTKPAPVTGSISMDGAAVTSTTTLPAQDIALTFTSSTPNQRITVQSSGYTFLSDCNASSIEFNDSTGAETASSKPCPGLVALKLGPNTGPYTLDFSHWLQDTGSLTLQLASIHDVTGTIAIGGAPVTAATTVPLQLILLTFNITTANQAFTVQPSGSTFSNCYQAEMFILDSTGTRIPQWYYYLCGGVPGPQLPVGTYTLEIVPWGQETGGATVQLTSP